MKDGTQTTDSTQTTDDVQTTTEADFKFTRTGVRQVRPDLGCLHSGIYHLWNSLPRKMGSPDVYNTYTIMALACGEDIESLPHDDPRRKFIRRMTVEQCLMIADAVLEDPGGNPSRFNPLALLHRGSSHIKLAQSWATVIRFHIKNQHLRHLLVEACIHEDRRIQAERREAARIRAEKRRAVKREEALRQERQKRHRIRTDVTYVTRRYGKRHGENLRAHLEGRSLPYPYRCTVCGFITSNEHGMRAHVTGKHGDHAREEPAGEVLTGPVWK